MKTQMFIADVGDLDLQYQNWLDKNPIVEIISTALTFDKEQGSLVFIVTYKDSEQLFG